MPYTPNNTTALQDAVAAFDRVQRSGHPNTVAAKTRQMRDAAFACAEGCSTRQQYTGEPDLKDAVKAFDEGGLTASQLRDAAATYLSQREGAARAALQRLLEAHLK